MSGPVAKSLVLSDHERSVLAGWIRRPTSSARLVQRSQIVMAYADSGSVADVARRVGVSAPTVSKWRDRFLVNRLDGLEDAPRPGQPRKLTDEQIAALITRTLDGEPPGGDTHWSTRSMAADQGLNQSAVSRIWRAFGLKPHLVDSWKLSKDPDFVDKVRDIVGLYMSPPENALVLAVDEKSQVQALDRTAPILPLMPTTPARATHDYVRHGTTSVFAAMDIVSGSVVARQYRRHRSAEFLRFLKDIDAATPKDQGYRIVDRVVMFGMGLLSSRAMTRSTRRAMAARVGVMVVIPAARIRPRAVLRWVAITRGRVPVRISLRSSS